MAPDWVIDKETGPGRSATDIQRTPVKCRSCNMLIVFLLDCCVLGYGAELGLPDDKKSDTLAALVNAFVVSNFSKLEVLMLLALVSVMAFMLS